MTAKEKRSMLTQERASELLKYCSDTGKVYWRVSPCNATKKGEEIGRLMPDGYRTAKVDYVTYPVHRIVWLLVHGEFPKQCIDHIDGNRSNNRVENLRDVSRGLNQRNRMKSKNNTSGVTGVCWDKRYCRWVSKVKVDGRTTFLGGFQTVEEAKAVRDKYLEERPWLGFTARPE